MPSVGERLRLAREARGLTVDEIARRTRITRQTLGTLEAMDLERLPAAIYTRGFVSSYAREVGLDPAATAAAYLSAVTRAEEAAAQEPGASALAPSAQASDAPRVVATLVALACVAGLVAYVWSGRRGEAPSDSVVGAFENAAPERAIEPPPANAERVTAQAPTAAARTDGRLRIELQATGPCWVVATVDGSTALTRLLARGERHAFDVVDALTLRVGEPGALRYTIDGREGRPLGQPGQPVTVRITPRNVGEFLP